MNTPSPRRTRANYLLVFMLGLLIGLATAGLGEAQTPSQKTGGDAATSSPR